MELLKQKLKRCTHPAHEEFPQITGSPCRMYHAPSKQIKLKTIVGDKLDIKHKHGTPTHP